MCGNREIEGIGTATVEEMLPVWLSCFSDSRDTITAFFQVLDGKVQSVVYRAEGTAASMVQIVEAELVLEGQRYPASYLYAVGTIPSFRGRGYSSALLEEVLKRQREQGKICFLVPAEKKLVGFYRRLGMQVMAREQAIRLVTLGLCKGKRGELTELSAEAYLQMRDRMLRGKNHARLCHSAETYDLHIWQEEGGRIGSLLVGGEVWGVLYRRERFGLFIKEITEPDEEKAISLARVMAGCLRALTVRLYRGCAVMADEAAWREQAECYFNLPMD